MNRVDLARLVNATNRIDGLYYRLSQIGKVSQNTTALLYALSDGKAHSQKEISDEWFIPRTTLNSIVKILRDEGYMTLSCFHGKEKCMILTDTGHEYAKKTLMPIFDAEDKVMHEMNDISFICELERFSNFLEKATTELEERSSYESK